MTENGSRSLAFDSSDEENAHLREENARLRRLLTVHGISIPPLPPANPLPIKTVETVASKSVPRKERYLCATVAERRWPVGIYAGRIERLESHSEEQSRGPKEGRSEDRKFLPL